MLDVSWGETILVVGLGLALIGRHDLPQAARVVGTQVGRIVGLLQGARARADKFAAQNELKQLQNELRSGLRELDAVKSELAVSLSGPGLMGRQLGTMVSGANKVMVQPVSLSYATPTATSSSIAGPSSIPALDCEKPSAISSSSSSSSSSSPLPPVHQTIAAVAEEEWSKRGIAFQSQAERGAGLASSSYDPTLSGSVVLAKLLQQTLIFDQYDRVVQQQDQLLHTKMEQIQTKLQTENSVAVKTDSLEDRRK